MAIRDPQKPNQLSADKSGYGSMDSGNDFDTDDASGTGGASDSDQDDFTPQKVGAPADSMDHNSDYLKPLQLPQD
jgi:hypothetical protein